MLFLLSETKHFASLSVESRHKNFKTSIEGPTKLFRAVT